MRFEYERRSTFCTYKLVLTEKTGRLTKMRFAAWIKISVGENVGDGWLFVMGWLQL